ncbi:MAG: hypothetical protein R6V38_03040 [Roseovarius gahaiensis]
MFLGLVLAGSVIGAVFALSLLILGHSVWLALLTYSAIGTICVLAGAAALVLRSKSEEQAEPTKPYLRPDPQRG